MPTHLPRISRWCDPGRDLAASTRLRDPDRHSIRPLIGPALTGWSLGCFSWPDLGSVKKRSSCRDSPSRLILAADQRGFKTEATQPPSSNVAIAKARFRWERGDPVSSHLLAGGNGVMPSALADMRATMSRRLIPLSRAPSGAFTSIPRTHDSPRADEARVSTDARQHINTSVVPALPYPHASSSPLVPALICSSSFISSLRPTLEDEALRLPRWDALCPRRPRQQEVLDPRSTRSQHQDREVGCPAFPRLGSC